MQTAQIKTLQPNQGVRMVRIKDQDQDAVNALDKKVGLTLAASEDLCQENVNLLEVAMRFDEIWPMTSGFKPFFQE